jgi:hypothetical protein
MLDKATKVAAAVPNAHNLHSTATKKLQRHAHLTQQLARYGNWMYKRHI